MKKNKKVTLIIMLFVLVIASLYFFYGFIFKEARHIESEVPSEKISAVNLMASYNSNQAKSDSVYLNKTIEVTGKVTMETDSVIVLENSVFCLFTQKNTNKLLDSQVTVKGKCIGYDELFKEVKLDQCSINQQNN